MTALRFSRLSRVFYLLFMLSGLAACDWGGSPPVQPVADAGTDQSVGSGAAVTLDGTGSTADGGLSYFWTQTAGTPVTVLNANSSMPTFTAPTVAATEVLSFELTVTDQYGQTSVDSVDITVVDGGPTADAGTDQAVAEGAAVTLDGTNSSHNSGGVIASYAWVQTAGTAVNNLAGADTATPTFDAPVVAMDEVVTFELTVTDDDGDTDTDTVDIAVRNDTAPVADAGIDQSVDEGTTPVTLDGTNSSDAVGAIATYAWVQTAGTVAALTNADTETPTFTAPQVGAAGDTLTFELTVTDDAGQSDTDTVDVVVNNVNDSPTADAGPDQLVGEGVAVNLDGSGSSDSDGSIATYAWVQTAGPNVTLTNPDTATPSFTAPLVAAQVTMTFELTVTDDLGAPDTDTVDITINVFNAAPTANAGPDQTVEELTAVNLDGSASSDIDGAIATYAWVQTAGTNAPLTNGTAATPSFTAPDVAATETLTFQLTVTDNDAMNPKQGVDSVDITVEPANVAPTADAGPDQSVDEQSTVNLDGTGSTDSDGSIASYAWTQTVGTVVTVNNAATASPDFTAPSVDAAGETLTFELTVTDDDGATATDTVDIQIDNDPTLANPPMAAAGTDQVVSAGDTVTLDGSGSSDTDGTITAYQWTQTGGTTTVTLNNAGTAVATFTAPAAPDTLTFQLTVTDDDAATGTDTISIKINAPPAADAGTDQTVVAAALVTLDGTGSSDVDGTISNYAWTQTGGTVVTLTNADQASASFTSPAAPDTLTFQLVVTDNDGATDLESVIITVNSPPTANAGANQSVDEQSAVNLTGAASSDSDGAITSYAWTQTAGTTVSLTGENTATPSFTAPAVDAAGDTLTFSLTVTDDDGATDTDTVDVQVNNDPALSNPPTAVAGPDQVASAADIVTLDGSSSSDSDGTITGYQWTQTGGTTTVTLNTAATSVATFTAPAAPDVLTFQLEVTDNDGATSTDTASVKVNAPPTANAGTNQSVDEQSVVNLSGTGSSDVDGTVASYSWSQTAGTAVVLTGAGTATPSFTAPSVDVAGETLTFDVTVTDEDGATDTDSVDVQVNNDPTLGAAPTAVAGNDQVVSATDAVTLDGSGSSDSDGTITAYQWTQTGGTATVTLNNAATSVATFTAPAAPDVLTFQLEVTDDDAATGTDIISIKINAPPTANAGPDQSVDEQSTVNLTAATSSDVDGTIAVYAWTQTGGTTVTLTGPGTSTPSFTAPSVDVAGETLTFSVTVTDEDGATDNDSVDIQVNNDPALGNPPTAVGGPDQVASAADVVTLDGSSSSDSDGTITAYQWTQTGGTTTVTLNNAGTAVASFTAPAAPDLLTFQLEVTDNDAATGTDTVSVKVNAPPTANAGPDQSIDEQSTVNLTAATSSDVDGTITDFVWTQTGGTTVTITGGNTATPSFTAPSVDAAGETLTFSVTVTDEDGATDNDSVSIQVNNDPALGSAPTAVAGTDQVVSATDTVTLDGSGSSDSDGTITSYQWTQTGGTTTVTLNNAGTSVATFTAPAAPDTLSFELEVTDDDAATDTDTISIKVNAPPTANAGTDQTVDEETTVNLNGAASSDVDGTISSYSWAQTAGTAVVINNAGTATPSFTAPSVDLAGETLTFEVTVTDEDGATDNDTVDIQVDNDATLNVPPVAAAGPDQNVGPSVTVNLDGSGSTDDTVVTDYLWTQTAGTTVTITNANQAMASFTSPATSETMTFQLEVTDEEGGTNTDTVDVVVTAGPVTISGAITYHHVPHAGLGLGGLDYGSTVERPARLVTVQIIDAGDDTTVLASDVTAASGNYSMSVDSSTDVFLRVRAEMVNAGPSPSWDFHVVDNTNGDALYVLDSVDFNSGGTDQTINVLAATVFDGNDYTVRNGAIFAILDGAHDAFQEVLAVVPTTDFTPLSMHWSVNNTPVSGDISMGEIGTSFYRGGNPIDGLYLLGDEDVDTEEYDKHVITHEFGHYMEDTLARSDSIGGAHGPLDVLDIRVAFGEGFGNAWSAIPTNDTTYIDTQGINQSLAGGMDIEDGTIWNGTNTTAGWFSERSVQEAFYDLYDSNSDGADTLSLGFGPLWSVMTGAQTSTPAFTSIFSFVDALKTARPGDAAAIDALLTSQSVDSVADEWGTGETNNAGVPDSLPVYKMVTVDGAAVNVCSNDSFGGVNKLNTIQYVRFTITTAGMHDFDATATVIPAGQTTDPDMWLRIPFINPAGIYEVFESEDANSESGTSGNSLPLGDYILEVFDFNNRGSSKLQSAVFGGPSIGRACFDITITGP